MQRVTAEVCPAPDRLLGYVSGQLDESVADELAAHLEACPQCQRRVDELAGQPDSVVTALRRPPSQPQGQESQLHRLMAAAAQPDTMPLTSRTKQSSAKETVSLDEFVNGLRRSRLLEPSDVDLLQAQLSPRDARSFARALVKLKKLTPFQARAILQGRHQHLVLGNYEVLEQLGEGGMGRVFKARHRQLGRIVCLKVLHAAGRNSPQLVERFRREAQMVAALSHPHIVVAHDAAEADGMPYLAMEFIAGQDLARHVEQHGPVDTDTAVQMVLQAAQALGYAHSQGVIHRDVKPSNLLLAQTHEATAAADSQACFIKVLDLGLARFDSLLGENPDALSHTSMTSTGAVMGTVDYMAPEQAANSRKADHRSDIYSLGCTLFYLLTGRTMYDGETVMEKLIAHREARIPSLIDAGAETPAALDAIFQRMVAKDPERRYRSMLELEEDVKLLQGGQLPRAMTDFAAPLIIEPPPLPDTGRARRNQAIAAWSAAALLLAVLAGGWVAANMDWTQVPGSLGPAVDAAKEKDVVEASPTAPVAPVAKAVIVVPHDGFYSDHFEQVRDALDAEGVDWKVASSSAGIAKSKNNTTVPVDLTIDQCSADDFDAVFFVGGHVGEYTHKGASGKQARQLIERAIDQSRIVASVGNGWDVLNDTGMCAGCMSKDVSGLTRYASIDRPGVFLTAKESKQATSLVNVMLDELKSSSP